MIAEWRAVSDELANFGAIRLGVSLVKAFLTDWSKLNPKSAQDMAERTSRAKQVREADQ